MPKIIAVSEKTISIGFDSGNLRDVSPSDCNFKPKIGDEVEIFETGEKVIISRKDMVNPTPQININTSGATQTQYVVGGKPVNKIAYALFAIFLGSFGIHKFYAGKIGMGIVYLLFCWTFIPGIIGFIEGIIALTKQEDANGNIVI